MPLETTLFPSKLLYSPDSSPPLPYSLLNILLSIVKPDFEGSLESIPKIPPSISPEIGPSNPLIPPVFVGEVAKDLVSISESVPV